MSTEPVSSDVPESSAPDPDSESAPPPPSTPPPSTAPREWPAYGSWRRAPLLPLVVIAAVVIMLVAGVSSATGVLVGIIATKNADSHSRFNRPRHHGPVAPGPGRRDHRRVPRAVPTTPAAPAPAAPPTTPPAPSAPSPTTS